ncbi:hypothetical protein [Klenkia taihuensis]|uniref:Uncharacterized protein n=1 Tax=Klenkia taihuensis TaxID=1225127 RepID=A0A1I1QQ00_9ACTN|nr:hypothetical protein [Klenkia taihuensis]GHE07602.1 hypothetical protein GCM10011381_04720 [Klenkia taihuensis]SFD24129.1 hypothetical protein SAMN05661030_2897 [Klenkia taihuensis]
MSHSIDPTGSDPSTSSTTDVAKGEAAQVGHTAAGAAQQVAGTAADQAKEVAGEARRQASDLLQQGRGQATEQARAGQQKAAESLGALADELRSLTNGEGGSGPATDLLRQATERVDGFAAHLRDREPGDLLEDVRSFARRRPGAFLVGAAVAGVLAGRLTTGVVAAHKEGIAPGSSGGQAPHDVSTGTGPLPGEGVAVAPAYEPVVEPAVPPATGPGYDPVTGYSPVPPPPYGSGQPLGGGQA